MRLRRGLRVLPRGPGEVQVGTDPRWAVRVTDLTDDEVTALVTLAPGASLGGLAADDRLSPTRLAALVQELGEARLLEPPASRVLSGPRGADAAVLGLALPAGDGADVVAARARSSVGVVGLGPTGLGLACVLAAGGVGTLRLEDGRPVRSSDIGPSGYRWPDVGVARAAVAARVVTELGPEVTVEVTGEVTGEVRGGTAAGQVARPAEPRVDLLVVVAERALDPALGVGLLSAGTPHLLVLVREADTVVGPLVVAGDGPCARCLDLHRTDADPRWAAVAAALTRDAGAPTAEPHAVAAVAAGIAGAAVLATIDAGLGTGGRGDGGRGDGGRGDGGPLPSRRHRPLRGASVEIGLPDARPHERRWAAHPDCGCAALSGPVLAAEPGGRPDGPPA